MVTETTFRLMSDYSPTRTLTHYYIHTQRLTLVGHLDASGQALYYLR